MKVFPCVQGWSYMRMLTQFQTCGSQMHLVWAWLFNILAILYLSWIWQTTTTVWVIVELIKGSSKGYRRLDQRVFWRSCLRPRFHWLLEEESWECCSLASTSISWQLSTGRIPQIHISNQTNLKMTRLNSSWIQFKTTMRCLIDYHL